MRVLINAKIIYARRNSDYENANRVMGIKRKLGYVSKHKLGYKMHIDLCGLQIGYVKFELCYGV